MKRQALRESLNLFWGRVSQPGASRLRWLHNAATWHVETDREYLNIRKGSTRLPPVEGACFSCQLKKAVHRHHVVQIQWGGRNIERNVVHLCRNCHRSLHPWMVKSPGAEPAITTLTQPRLVKAVGAPRW